MTRLHGINLMLMEKQGEASTNNASIVPMKKGSNPKDFIDTRMNDRSSWSQAFSKPIL